MTEHDLGLVFLVHGFMRTGASMVPMSVGLARRGFRTKLVTQVNLHRQIPDLADELFGKVEAARDREQERTGRRPDAHFVTHSMGGIVLRSMLSRHEVSGPNRCVMLAPPNRGSRFAAHMRQRLALPWGEFDPLGKLLPEHLGQCAEAGDPDAVIGVIAGTGAGVMGAFPWNRLSGGYQPADEGAHDGKVALDEARLDGAELIEVPYAHSFLMAKPEVIEATARFLRRGTFAPSV